MNVKMANVPMVNVTTCKAALDVNVLMGILRGTENVLVSIQKRLIVL